jgi:predicted RNase H-like nuclease (RuvC/YqgF family)
MKDQQDRLRNEEQNKADASLAKEQEKIKELETELALSKDNIMDLSKISEKQKVEVEELKNKLTSCQDIQLNEIFKRDNTIEELKQKLHEFENQQHGQSSDQDDKEKSANFTAMLKESMNGMYGNIVASFNEDQQYQFSEISNVIAQNIKFTTLKIIQSFQQTYENLSDTS